MDDRDYDDNDVHSHLIASVLLHRAPREGIQDQVAFGVCFQHVITTTVDVTLRNDQENRNAFLTAVNNLRQLISDMQERLNFLESTAPKSIEPNEDQHIFDGIVEAHNSEARRRFSVGGLRKLRIMLDAHTDYVDHIVSVFPED